MEGEPVTARHEQAVGDRGPVARVRLGADEALIPPRQLEHWRRPAAVGVAHGEAHEDVRRPVVRLDLIGVEVLLLAALIGEPLGLGEVEAVVAGGGHDVADAIFEAAVVLAVLLPDRVPEHEILRVEGALGDDGLLAQEAEMHAVTRPQKVEPVRLSEDDNLDPLVLGAAWVRVEKDRRVGRVAADLGEGLGRHDDVVSR